MQSSDESKVESQIFLGPRSRHVLYKYHLTNPKSTSSDNLTSPEGRNYVREISAQAHG